MATQQVRCRELSDADIDAIADLQTRRFVYRSREYWMQGLRRQAARAVPQGYPRFGYLLDNNGVAVCSGLFFSIPALSRVAAGATISSETRAADGPPDADVKLLTSHARYGCLSLVCRTTGGPFPFILKPLRIRRGWIAPPAMQLIYCRDIAEYVRCAGAIGRVLIRRGKFSVILDADDSLPGLTGIYSEARGRKYFKGPHLPRLTDPPKRNFTSPKASPFHRRIKSQQPEKTIHAQAHTEPNRCRSACRAAPDQRRQACLLRSR